MKTALLALFCNFILINSQAKAQDSELGLSYWSDLKTTAGLLLQGSVEQFKVKNNLYYLAAGVSTTWYSFERDKEFSASATKKSTHKFMDLTGDLGVILNFPIIHGAFYAYGRKTKNQHHMQFAMEYFSSMYLALAESGIISFIQVHERPDSGSLNSWETGFRGDSSFPSGHVIPFYGLFFKTLQFYGPYWAIPPAIISVISAMQRVRSGKHYTSDVVSSFFFMAMASEGVRQAANYQDNHSFYKWVFEHQASLSVIRHDNVYGPAIVWNF
ncbi:hypothetical protein A9Q84_11520 [Halobacteriovorax marinus]|uniref:Phosphatidic acid phosphatase type 2/haloperoxidase domain-containing protein n=1 Tax=Halobacteriovorax marinus TaxID=97084 RepID=A0A1Y5F7S7_9BACT|nr:hypothetical protein A9Q84_11520 [Halobacteriovorax marinus]